MAVNLQAIQKKKQAAVKKENASLMDFLNRDISFGNAFGDKKKERFYSDLFTLFNAGVDIRTALTMLSEEQDENRGVSPAIVSKASRQKQRNIIESIRDSVVKGDSFSTAMKTSGYFSAYEYFSVKIGEETGRLPEVLNELEKYFQKRVELQRQMVKVFSYPLFVIFLAVGVVYFMMKYIVPMFGSIFKRFGGELPAMTKKVIWMSDMISAYSFYFFSSVFVIILFFYLQRKKEWFRKISSRIVLSIPLFGDLIRKVYMARFCQSMQLLVASHTSLTEALDMVKQMISFYPLEKALETMKEDLVKGKSMHESMRKFTIFDKKMISLIKVAEEVNQLDEMFRKLTKQYSDEVDHRTSTLGSIVEPMLMVIIGGIVGFILISLYLPMFNLGNTIK